MDQFYPAGPTSIPADLTKASSAYKQRAWLAVTGLALFILLYFGLTGWFVWTSYRMAMGLANGGDLTWQGIGAGVAAAFLAIFMIKALFFVKQHRNISDVEIKPEEHPQLFAFIHRLADDAGAPRPYKVFLSSDINAAVFYDLSILNLIFPSKKNLLIGLGLVNVLTLSEFKAVLAHEFGHFAQRSMAVGRWVYIAQQIASQIVDRRDALDAFLNGLSRFDLRIAWIGWILSLVVWSIRSLLDSAHKLVVLALRALSRQMEFQADLVAVSLTGSDALVHALHKLRTADDAWMRAVSIARGEMAEGRGVKDLFAIQSYILEKLRFIFNDPTYGLITPVPADKPEDHRVFDSKLASPPQMWSTHPESFAREENAKRRYIACADDSRSAWVIFSNSEELRETMTEHVLGDQKVEKVELGVTLKQVEQKFSRTYLMPQFRGIYLGRSFVRHTKHHSELLDQTASALSPADLDQLYPESLTDCLERLKSLEDERHHLRGLKQKAFKANGGAIRFRGQTISKRELAKAIETVEADIRREQDTLHAHDKSCRTFHLAAATQVGENWDAYLRGLLSLIHYADHSEADLYDVMALVNNTVAVITADKKVSRSELNRLLSVTKEAHGVLAQIYSNAAAVSYDAQVAKGLKNIESWPEVLGEFTLPPADATNINQWMGVFENWIRGTAAALSSLKYAALEQLLLTESKIADAFRSGQHIGSAPPAPTAPEKYRLLLPGSERQLQARLDFWDSFRTATGIFPATARFVAAAAIITAVFIWGQYAGRSDVAIYNGLNQTVEVNINGEHVTLQPYRTRTLNLTGSSHTISTSTRTGQLIEEFTYKTDAGSNMHFVYNIANAAPLVKWTAVYGSTAEVPEQRLGNQRWFMASADHYFTEPPESISTSKHQNGGTRTVISGFASELPENVLSLLDSDQDKRSLTEAHARWDDIKSPNYLIWLALAAQYDSFADILQQRLQEYPHDVGLLRQEQNFADTVGDRSVCERHSAQARSDPEDPNWQYLAARCLTDDQKQNAAFVQAAEKWPQHPWLAMAAAYADIGVADWEAGSIRFEQAMQSQPQLKPLIALDVERVERVLSRTGQADDSVVETSRTLQMYRTLDTGSGLDHSPYGAYHLVNLGKFDEALRLAADEPEVRFEIKRFVAASIGAQTTHIDAALRMDDTTGINLSSVWSALALAARMKRDEQLFVDFIETNFGIQAEPALRFWTHIKKGQSVKDADMLLEGTTPAMRAHAYVMAAVYLQDACPKQWRNLADAILFAHEKPKLL